MAIKVNARETGNHEGLIQLLSVNQSACPPNCSSSVLRFAYENLVP